MHRRALLELLDRYRIIHPSEAECIGRIRALVTEYSNCFERSCWPGHVTASAWILSSDRSRCLLTHHRKLGRWLQLGGHADGDPNVWRVAQREAREESGLDQFDWVCGKGGTTGVSEPVPLDVDVHRIPARGSEPEHEHHDIRFLAVARAGQELCMSDESVDLGWFAFSDLEGLGVDASVVRLAKKAQILVSPGER